MACDDHVPVTDWELCDGSPPASDHARPIEVRVTLANACDIDVGELIGKGFPP